MQSSSTAGPPVGPSPVTPGTGVNSPIMTEDPTVITSTSGGSAWNRTSR